MKAPLPIRIIILVLLAIWSGLTIAGAVLKYEQGAAGNGPALLKAGGYVLSGMGVLLVLFYRRWLSTTDEGRKATRRATNWKHLSLWILVGLVLVIFFDAGEQSTIFANHRAFWNLIADIGPFVIFVAVMAFLLARSHMQKRRLKS